MFVSSVVSTRYIYATGNRQKINVFKSKCVCVHEQVENRAMHLIYFLKSLKIQSENANFWFLFVLHLDMCICDATENQLNEN